MFVQAPKCALPSEIFVHVATVVQEKITIKHFVAKHTVKMGGPLSQQAAGLPGANMSVSLEVLYAKYVSF